MSDVNSSNMDFNNNSFDDDGEASEEHKKVLKLQKILEFGMYIDIEEKIVTLLLPLPNYISFIQSLCNADGVGYRLYFFDSTTGKLFKTPKYVASNKLNVLQDMYIQYLRIVDGACRL